MEPVTDDLIVFAERLADAARPAVLRHFRTLTEIAEKDNRTPVTAADKEAEAAMRALIEETHPDHGIAGEELGATGAGAAFQWLLDPIDGTTSFVIGRPIFATLIGLAFEDRPVLGIIDQPVLDERWIGAAGRPTSFNRGRAETRSCAELGAAWLATTGPQYFDDEEAAAFRNLSRQVRNTVYGGDAYSYGLLALGHVDLVCEAGLNPWDFCALAPVIEGAGGTVTDWTGAALTIGAPGRVLAAGDARVHAQALETLGGA